MSRVAKTYNPTKEHNRFRIYPESCCYPMCETLKTEKAKEPLCDRHLISVYRSVVELTKALDPHSDAVVGPAETYRRNPYGPVGKVYFMRFSDRVKIGFTMNLRQRLLDVPNDELLGSMKGSRHTESSMHKRFAHLRITGEWFSMGEDLMQFISTLERTPISSS